MTFTYSTTGNKYDPEFCSLIGANPNIKYTKANIYNLLCSQSLTKNKYCKFEPKLDKYLSNIKSSTWYGYNKSTIYTILNAIMIQVNLTNNKYVVISSNKSDVIIKEITVIL